MNATEPSVPMLPPHLEKAWRTSATVRTRLSVRQAMESAGLVPGYAEVTFRADNDIAVAGETAQQVSRLLVMLEDLDDVQNVYSNADLGDAG